MTDSTGSLGPLPPAPGFDDELLDELRQDRKKRPGESAAEAFELGHDDDTASPQP